MQGLAPSDFFLFEDFRLDRRGDGLFRCNGADTFEPVAIGSRALDILGVLIERAGEVVSKNEIIAAVWHGTVVEDSSLTVQLSALRRVLDRGRSNDRVELAVMQTGSAIAGSNRRTDGAGWSSDRTVAPTNRADGVLDDPRRWASDADRLRIGTDWASTSTNGHEIAGPTRARGADGRTDRTNREKSGAAPATIAANRTHNTARRTRNGTDATTNPADRVKNGVDRLEIRSDRLAIRSDGLATRSDGVENAVDLR